MPKLFRRLLLAGPVVVLSLTSPAAALAGPTVTVRIEGQGTTLVEEKAVTLDDAPVPGTGCPGASAGGAIEKATGGNWDRSAFVSTILGESHTYAASDYWAFWLNEAYSQTGLCDTILAEGARVLMFVQVDDANFSGTLGALRLTGVPATVAPGAPFTATVSRYTTDGTTTFGPTPLAGATFTGASATTGGDGTATITLTDRGPHTIKAAKGPERTQAASVCVTDGADGFCGTTKPGDPAPTPTTPSAPCITTGDDGLCGTTDTRAPGGSIGSVKEQQRFAKGKGPRTLAGEATDAQGIRKVRLRLTRSDRGRCTTFDGRRERFVAMQRCGAARGTWFAAGTRGEWSYLLPARLPRGRYVLDVEATDGSGNVDTRRERGRNRVVFHVA